uniref:Uncharacterized protein n=1 Tax=viral metagenome TaxID=1070528 RepID=A0A6C0JCF8_9ZZZZ
MNNNDEESMSMLDESYLEGGTSEVEVDEGDEIDIDEVVSEDDEEDISILNKLKISQTSEISSKDRVYEEYYSGKRQTSHFLTKFERAKLLGTRAEMLASGSPALVNVPSYITSAYDIALLEFKEKKIPLIIKRALPDGTYEFLRLEDLLI